MALPEPRAFVAGGDAEPARGNWKSDMAASNSAGDGFRSYTQQRAKENKRVISEYGKNFRLHDESSIDTRCKKIQILSSIAPYIGHST